MAIHDKLGFYPNQVFLHYQIDRKKEIPEMWEETREILGDRKNHMVYTEAGYAYNDCCYVVDCLVGAKSRMGIDIAKKLAELTPDCTLQKGRKILITDVINPFQIPHISLQYQNDEEQYVGSDEMFVAEDERYLVGIIEEGESVHMYLFKKV